MILKIRNSRAFKGLSLMLAMTIFFEIVAPNQALALTGGPAQPEFNSFTPIGVSDMVDLSSGDMSYNIPLLDVGGYPLNISYSAEVGMDQEASWVGLGWNLSVGQINRSVRGLPDDFKGDEIRYENYLRPNITTGADFKFTPSVAGVDNIIGTSDDEAGILTLGVSAIYNNYSGFTIKPSVGIQIDLNDNVSVGFSASSGPDGLSISPSLSIHEKSTKKSKRNNQLGVKAGVAFNSRQGLTSASLNMTKSSKYQTKEQKLNGTSSKSNSSIGSSIGFTDQLYTPTRRVGMVTGSFTVNGAFGGELFTVEGQGQVTAFGTIVKVKKSEEDKLVKSYGYNHTDLAGEYDVLDFNREKDGSFSVNSTNLPITNYTYDIYSVQGQGVSGMFRPFRNQVGYVYDARVDDGSTSGTFGFEAGTGNAVHLGLDVEVSNVQSQSGVWKENNRIIDHLKEDYSYNLNYEKTHYKNVGDLSADEDFNVFTDLGSYQPIRIPFYGNQYNRWAANEYEIKSTATGTVETVGIGSKIKRTQRQKRNQTIFNLTKQDLENGKGFGPYPQEYSLPSQAKLHHTAEVQITRNDGARYIYGLPAYNLIKKEATFAVDAQGDCGTGLVNYNPISLSIPSTLPNDQYLNRTSTPAYVLSTDYQDKTNNGPSIDDLGSYTKFSYVKMNDAYEWRVPFGLRKATYNEGLKTNVKDDQGNYVYGVKELYYIDKIETKTHVAIFKYSPRKDAKGVIGENGGIDPGQNSYKLDKIILYSIGEYYEAGLSTPALNPTPIKEVNFEYSYSLCPDVPNNSGQAPTDNEISNFGGKLTLKKIYFTYRKSLMGKYTNYKFNYDEFKDGKDEYSDLITNLELNTNFIGSGTARNPFYNIKGYDSWGIYKPNIGGCINTDELTAAEFPYTEQNKSIQDIRASAWSLSKISLPSGGSISINYESDDYAFVQNKKVQRMFKVRGAGHIADGATHMSTTNLLNSKALYNVPLVDIHKKFIYVEVDNNSTLTVNDYLGDIIDEPIYFRFLMNMTQLGGVAGTEGTAKYDYVSGYFQIKNIADAQFFYHNSIRYLSIPVKLVDKEGGLSPAPLKVNPFSKAAWNFGRKYLNQHVYAAQPNGNSEDIPAVVTELLSPSVLSNLMEVFEGPNGTLENKGVGKRFMKDKSWVRLMEPDQQKLGGGCRVRQVRMSDVWAEMNNLGQGQTSNYGQNYKYELANGLTSGVASYEPIGNKENPFVQPVPTTVKHLLAPDEENYIEKPFGESFFPNPKVTYSRVTVSNLIDATNSGYEVKRLHRTGSVVTEFYTTKDYPTIVDQTKLQAEEDNQQVLDNLLKLSVRKHFTASQGYVIHLNDMDGKQKSQRVYAEDQTAPISGVDYLYDSYSSPLGFNASSSPEINKGRLNNLVPTINPDGTIEMKVIGVEVDIVNDFRENKTKTKIPGINGNLASFFVSAILGLVPIPLPDYSQTEDQFRSVSTTKVINTFGILKETIAYDAGATVYTKNVAWDAATGEVLVTETVDEYNDKYYTLNYPAHWYYQGMGQASRNLGLKGNIIGSGNIYTMTSPYNFADYFTPGDELITNTGQKAWVEEFVPTGFKLIDLNGNAIVGATGFEVIRSGHRNLQSAGIMNVTLMQNPIFDNSNNLRTDLGGAFLASSNWVDWEIINAGAVDYSDYWPVDCECGVEPGLGIYNPYVINEKGVWRTKSSRTYLTGRNSYGDVTPRRQGFFTKFSPMYQLSATNEWTKDFTDWTFVAEVTKYSPYGFELENADALNRYSAAQYGYNNTFPIAVGANTKYREIGFDGFEDRDFPGCPSSAHFQFEDGELVKGKAHTGLYSIKVPPASMLKLKKKLECPTISIDGNGGIDPSIPTE